jgi:hypothetical protein
MLRATLQRLVAVGAPVLVAAVLLGACGSKGAAADTLGSPHTCAPGTQASCACPGGTTGVHECLINGTFGACSCPSSSAPSDAGTDGDGDAPHASASMCETALNTMVLDLGLIGDAALGDPSPCTGSTTVLHIAGDQGDYISQGATFTAPVSAQPFMVCPYQITFPAINVPGQGNWSLSLSSYELGKNLTTATYEGCQRFPIESVSHPGFALDAPGRGCNMLSATFQIEELTWNGSEVASLTVTFEQQCDGFTPAARGCFHYQQ